LLSKVQASEAELLEALKKIEALEIDGKFLKQIQFTWDQACTLPPLPPTKTKKEFKVVLKLLLI